MAAPLEDPPPATWPAVLQAWYRASLDRSPDGWRACLSDDARNIGPDGSVIEGADGIVTALSTYYRILDPRERVDVWIAGDDDATFVWHGTVEPGTDDATLFCTVATVADNKIVEIRFFVDVSRLASLLGQRR